MLGNSVDTVQGNCQGGIQVSCKESGFVWKLSRIQDLKRPNFSEGLERLKKVDLALNWRMDCGRTEWLKGSSYWRTIRERSEKDGLELVCSLSGVMWNYAPGTSQSVQFICRDLPVLQAQNQAGNCAIHCNKHAEGMCESKELSQNCGVLSI